MKTLLRPIILSLCEASPGITRPELFKAMDCSDSALRDNLRKMIKDGELVPYGDGREYQYCLPDYASANNIKARKLKQMGTNAPTDPIDAIWIQRHNFIARCMNAIPART